MNKKMMLFLVVVSIGFLGFWLKQTPKNALDGSEMLPLASTTLPKFDHNVYFLESPMPPSCEEKDGVVKLCINPAPLYITTERYHHFDSKFGQTAEGSSIRKIIQRSQQSWQIVFYQQTQRPMIWIDPYDPQLIHVWPSYPSVSQIQALPDAEAPTLHSFSDLHTGMKFPIKNFPHVAKYKWEWTGESRLELSTWPTDGKKIRIWIDPGHGGTDTGTQENGIVEKQLTLIVSQKLKVALQKFGHEVTLSRESDQDLDLWKRFKDIQDHNYDLALSIHFDHILQEEIRDGGRPACYYNNSLFRPVAEGLCRVITSLTNEPVATVKRHLMLLNYPFIPVVLLEVLNLQRPDHKRIYMDKTRFEEFSSQWSEATALAIHKLYEKAP